MDSQNTAIISQQKTLTSKKPRKTINIEPFSLNADKKRYKCNQFSKKPIVRIGNVPNNQKDYHMSTGREKLVIKKKTLERDRKKIKEKKRRRKCLQDTPSMSQIR